VTGKDGSVMSSNNAGKVISIKSRTEVRAYDAEKEREQNVIGIKIAEARKKTGMSLVSFSEHLKDYGVLIGDAALSKWENGKTVPNAYQLMALSCALGLEEEPQYFMGAYQSSLNDIGQQKVSDYKADLIATGKYKPEVKARTSIRFVEMPVSSLPVSAGTGAFLDEGNFEMLRFPESSVPEGAEFGIRVKGDSMEPVYHDGQIVWVRQCSELSAGQVGIFTYDGEGYLKAYDEQEPSEEFLDDFTDSYGKTHAQPVLISYNQEYDPIIVSPHAEFQIVGRVL